MPTSSAPPNEDLYVLGLFFVLIFLAAIPAASQGATIIAGLIFFMVLVSLYQEGIL